MRKFFFLAAVLAAFTAGFAQDVTYNFDNEANFEKYHTYKWVDIGTDDQLDELTRKQLISALDAAMAKKGLKKVDADPADLYVGYQLAFRGEKELTSYSTGWGYGPGWGGGWYGAGGMTTTRAQTNTIVIGTLVLDMYDSAKKNLVWRGKAEKTVDQNAKPDKRAKNMQKGADKLLKNYPPKKKK
jgi:hypothetical protein